MADSAVSTNVAKPTMRRLLHSQIKKNLVVGIIGAIATGILFQQLVAAPRKRRYAEFYRNYDAEKEFEEMRKKKVFQSC